MKVDLTKALLSIITLLLAIVGFMTRDAYTDMKAEVAALRSDVSAIKVSVAEIGTAQALQRGKTK